MSEKIKPDWDYVSFEIAPVVFPNMNDGVEVNVGGQDCKIGDFLGRIEGENGLPEYFVIPKDHMEKIEWLKKVVRRDRDILNLDVMSFQAVDKKKKDKK